MKGRQGLARKEIAQQMGGTKSGFVCLEPGVEFDSTNHAQAAALSEPDCLFESGEGIVIGNSKCVQSDLFSEIHQFFGSQRPVRFGCVRMQVDETGQPLCFPALAHYLLFNSV